MADSIITRVANALRPYMADMSDAALAARDAIEAMREPTDAMLKAPDCGSMEAFQHWRDMIDMALTEGD